MLLQATNPYPMDLYSKRNRSEGDMRMAVIGSPAYFKGRPEPKKPQIGHNCINLRLPTHGSLYAWEFERRNRDVRVRVEGQLTCNGTAQLLNGALSGLGLAYVPEGMVEGHIVKGGSNVSWLTGARRTRAITSIIRAADTRRRLSPPSSRYCAIEDD